MHSSTYLTPCRHGEAELTEKRSRFIGQVWPAGSEDEARAHVAEAKSAYHDARHNCWCYVIRGSDENSADVVRYTDDGEPQGTAGQPMLEVLRHAGAENVVCIVTRYFGGILLGTGGLTRAYAQAAKLALESAGLAEIRLMVLLRLVCPYGLYERVKIEIEAFGGAVDDVAYAADVTITAAFNEDRAEAFNRRLVDLTAGAVRGMITGTKYAANHSRQ
jgi:uncharacterized YigZ family protein